jgi:ELWxxDGT repeat protein
MSYDPAVVAGDSAFFMTENEGIWRVNDSAAAVTRVSPKGFVRGLTIAGINVYYWLNADLYSIPVSGGTPVRVTLKCKEACYLMNSGKDNNYAVVGNTLYFYSFASTGKLDARLRVYKTSGTLKSTKALTDGSGEPQQLVASGKYVYFVNRTESKGWAIWRTSGTVKGTKLFSDLVKGNLKADGRNESISPKLYVSGSGRLTVTTANVPLQLPNTGKIKPYKSFSALSLRTNARSVGKAASDLVARIVLNQRLSAKPSGKLIFYVDGAPVKVVKLSKKHSSKFAVTIPIAGMNGVYVYTARYIPSGNVAPSQQQVLLRVEHGKYISSGKY